MEHSYIEDHNIADRYLLGKLSAEERTQFEEHFVDCTQCLDWLETTDDFRTGLRTVVAAEALRSRAYVHAGFLARVAWLGRTRQAALLAGGILLIALPMALIILEWRSAHRDLTQAKQAVSEWQRKYEEREQSAKLLDQRALAIMEKTLGQENPNVAAALDDLASLYQDKGDYTRAILFYQRALAIRERALGPEHAEVATTLNNLANLYRERGENAKAEPLYRRALAIREKALVPHPPSVVSQERRSSAQREAVPQAVVPVFALSIVRGAAPDLSQPVNRIALSSSSKLIILLLELEPDPDLQSYRAALSTADGRSVWREGKLNPISRDALALSFNSKLFKSGNYLLTLDGLTAESRYVAIAQYTFRVVIQ